MYICSKESEAFFVKSLKVLWERHARCPDSHINKLFSQVYDNLYKPGLLARMTHTPPSSPWMGLKHTFLESILEF